MNNVFICLLFVQRNSTISFQNLGHDHTRQCADFIHLFCHLCQTTKGQPMSVCSNVAVYMQLTCSAVLHMHWTDLQCIRELPFYPRAVPSVAYFKRSACTSLSQCIWSTWNIFPKMSKLEQCMSSACTSNEVCQWSMLQYTPVELPAHQSFPSAIEVSHKKCLSLNSACPVHYT